MKGSSDLNKENYFYAVGEGEKSKKTDENHFGQ